MISRMVRTFALVRRFPLVPEDFLRALIVYGCALALIAAVPLSFT